MLLSELFEPGDSGDDSSGTVFLVSQDDGHLFIGKLTQDASHDIDLNDYDSLVNGHEVAKVIIDYVSCAIENATGNWPEDNSTVVQSLVRKIATTLDQKKVASAADVAGGWFSDEETFGASFFIRDVEDEVKKLQQFSGKLGKS